MYKAWGSETRNYDDACVRHTLTGVVFTDGSRQMSRLF
jgi:hypothetical protein